jgi:hypothetical protein
LGDKARGTHSQEPKAPVDKTENYRTNGNSPNQRWVAEIPDDSDINHPQQRSGKIRKYDWPRNVKHVLAGEGVVHKADKAMKNKG